MNPTLALVGSETLLGREVRDLAATTAAGFQLRLIAADDERSGTLTRVGDEPSVVSDLTAESFAGVHAIMLAGSPETSRKALELAEPDTTLIDLSGALDERPEARLRAPAVEGPDEEDDEGEAAIHVVAHPAAIALALFLRRVQLHDPIRRSVVQILAPASEHGTAGIEELQQQTAGLLAFKSLPQAIFGAQSAFNLLARYGEGASTNLEDTELRIERHLATLLALAGDGEGAPLPSLRVIQAPVFHGYSLSAWVEFEGEPDVEALESGLVAASIEVRGGEFEPPTNVGQAGAGGIAVGAILPDRNASDACWFWIVADNLRLSAENGVAVAKEFV